MLDNKFIHARFLFYAILFEFVSMSTLNETTL